MHKTIICIIKAHTTIMIEGNSLKMVSKISYGYKSLKVLRGLLEHLSL